MVISQRYSVAIRVLNIFLFVGEKGMRLRGAIYFR